MKARIIKITGIFLGIFAIALSAFTDEYSAIGRNITIEKGVVNHPNIEPVNAMIRTSYLGQPNETAKCNIPNAKKNPKDIAAFGFPEELFKRWPIAIIPIPTEFTANIILLNERK
jgi:hypothetical protein